MFRFQLQIAVVLLFGAVASAVAFWWNSKTSEGKIQLPLHGDSEHDPFDVTVPMDLVDGYPVEEQQFWTKVWTCAKL